MRDEDLLLPFA